MSEEERIIIVEKKSGNGLGTAGLVLSIIALVLCWIPYANFILWTLGFVFSLVGVFKAPRGNAIAGLIISCFFIILIIVLVGAFLGAATLSEL